MIMKTLFWIDASGVDYNTYEEALESAFLEALKTWI